MLVAPPGTGKTTLVPLALADVVTGRVLVAEPRRIAVRAAARRMASLVSGDASGAASGEVGGAVGYTIRGERRVGPSTRVEVVTTGVLEAPGRVYRCWSAAEHDRLPAQAEPEITVADLTGFALDLAVWGHPGGAGLELLSDPPAGAMEAAGASLRALGALDAAGRVTPRGRAIAEVGAHPRLARALIDGTPAVGARRAAEVVAILSGDGLARVGPSDDLMAGGTAAELTGGSALTGAEWLAIAVADRGTGRTSARVRLAVTLDAATAREAGAALLRTVDEVAWSGGDVVARRADRLGAIVLAERPLVRPDRSLLEAAVLDGLRHEGLAALRWTRDAVELRERLAFCHRVLGEPWPEVSDAALVFAERRTS